jgi:hypothetical protein
MWEGGGGRRREEEGEGGGRRRREKEEGESPREMTPWYRGFTGPSLGTLPLLLLGNERRGRRKEGDSALHLGPRHCYSQCTSARRKKEGGKREEGKGEGGRRESKST